MENRINRPQLKKEVAMQNSTFCKKSVEHHGNWTQLPPRASGSWSWNQHCQGRLWIIVMATSDKQMWQKSLLFPSAWLILVSRYLMHNYWLWRGRIISDIQMCRCHSAQHISICRRPDCTWSILRSSHHLTLFQPRERIDFSPTKSFPSLWIPWFYIYNCHLVALIEPLSQWFSNFLEHNNHLHDS